MIPDLNLRDGIHIPASTVKGFLWGGVESGVRWLEKLPTLLDAVCQEHNITGLHPSPEMRLSLVLFGESATYGEVVLKIALPYPEIESEFGMNLYVSGRGYPTIFDSDVAAGWLLMERIQPGMTMQNLAQIHAVADDEATELAADLLLRTNLPVPMDAPFPDLRHWLKSLFEYKSVHGENGPLPMVQVELALRHAGWLLNLPDERRLLHGDFHHGNIIQGHDGWMLIDPKGLIAPLAFEVGPWFYNPLDINRWPYLLEVFDTRLNIFSEVLKIDRVTLWRAAFVACVLSDCWTVEDGPVEHTHFDSVTAALMQLPERYL